MFFNQIFNALTKKERTILFVAAAIFCVSGILWIGYFISQNTVEVPVESGKYIEGVVGQPKFINPIISNTDTDRDLAQITYADLSDLSDRYTTSDDGKTWNVFLKTDLLWSDGKPLTSDDIIFTIETIQDSEAHSPLFTTWQGIVAERISELEIEFNLRNPYAFFSDNIQDLKIIPRHIFGAIPASNLKLSNYNLEPVGSGPYIYKNYSLRKDGFITEYNFEANPNYSGKKPFIQKLSVKFFQGSDELIDAFNSRRIDGFGNLSPKNIDKIKITNKISELKMPRYYAVFLNQNMHDGLKDAAVREALNLATDKNKIIGEVFAGKAEAANQPLTSSIEGYDQKIGMEDFSIETASTTLDKAGWLPNKETGIREKKIGKNTVKLEFQIIVPQIQFLVDTANIIKDGWKNIGVELSLITLNPNDINEEIIKTRNYQMLIFGNILKNNPDIFSFWHSSEKFYPGLNLSLYQNKKADDAIEAIRKELDPQKRIEKTNGLQSIISADRPAIFLFSPYYLYASVKNLGGMGENALVTPSDRFQNIGDWYLQTSRVFK